jgi:hypothetical protein
VKVVFKPKRVEIKEQKASIKESLDNNPNDFNDIIKCLIDNEKNTYLFQAYEMIVNSKTVDTNDILFL